MYAVKVHKREQKEARDSKKKIFTYFSVDRSSYDVFSAVVYPYFLAKFEQSILITNTCARTSNRVTCVEHVFKCNGKLAINFYNEDRGRMYNGSRVNHDGIINKNYSV